jgi:hypothetical protein
LQQRGTCSNGDWYDGKRIATRRSELLPTSAVRALLTGRGPQFTHNCSSALRRSGQNRQ